MSLVMFRFLYEMCLILPTYLSLLIRNMKPGFHWFLSFIFFAPCFWISSPVPGVVYLWWLYWLRMEYGFSSLDPCVEPPEYNTSELYSIPSHPTCPSPISLVSMRMATILSQPTNPFSSISIQPIPSTLYVYA